MKPPKSGITPAPGDEPVVVEIMNGPEDGREIICDGFPITIGRGKESAVRLQCDHLVSRNHARITKSDVGFILSDMGSTNGTFVGRKRVRKTASLRFGKLFRVGATLLMVRRRPPGVPPEQAESEK